MRNKCALLLLLLMCMGKVIYAQELCPVIPLPNYFKNTNEICKLDNNTRLIVKEPAFKTTADFLQQQVQRYTSITIATQKSKKGISIVFKKENNNSTKGVYKLRMTGKQITISAANEEGAFYGAVSLLQIIAQSAIVDDVLSMQCWNLQDAPVYEWRGFMLDESRHFFGKEKVKQILDMMAFYKLNRFHWHLTDEPAWRLEIKQYPFLALKGGMGNSTDSFAPAKYYSQTDITEIVNYAQALHITIIPEVDMPGHATAANKAYPQYSGGGSKGHPAFTFNPGKEETYQYLSNILKEVNELFPSKMIHLGGDEVSFGNNEWENDPAIQRLMKNEKLINNTEVEQYFIKRMADSIVKLNSTVVGWDEIANSNLSPDKTIVFWWRQEAPEQLKKALAKKFPVVLCPRLPLYFDFVQDSTNKVGRRWNGKYNSPEKVYAFSHEQYPEAVANRNLILGIQANLWTETVSTEKRLDYLMFPRLCALAETAWTEPSKKDYKQFEQRLQKHLLLLKQKGIYYYDPINPRETPEVRR
ncbi:beta-N-acetylhexosaminidase [Chitinophagaceae bacterium LWZ2-11]